MNQVNQLVTAKHLQSGLIYRQSCNGSPFIWGWLFDDSQALFEGSVWKVAIYTNWQIEHDSNFKRLTKKELLKELAI
jgi:hypothetical protein